MGLLEKLENGVVIGDGGFVFALEKRGYVKAGKWTPEVCVENPEAVYELHKEFIRAGADVVQAFTFYGNADKLKNVGDPTDINKAAVNLAKQAAHGTLALTAGGICRSDLFLRGENEETVKEEFTRQISLFGSLDFLICEYFEAIEEIEWAIEACKEAFPNKPIVASMCVSPEDNSLGEYANRMVEAGADVIGVNCHYDPFVSLKTIELMKKDLKKNVPLICQPLAFFTPEVPKKGFIELPEFPFALENRICTRWDIQDFARKAYELGVSYIGGCCGFEPYHIRAISEELEKERNKKAIASEKHGHWGESLKEHSKSFVRSRIGKDYWKDIGR